MGLEKCRRCVQARVGSQSVSRSELDFGEGDSGWTTRLFTIRYSVPHTEPPLPCMEGPGDFSSLDSIERMWKTPRLDSRRPLFYFLTSRQPSFDPISSFRWPFYAQDLLAGSCAVRNLCDFHGHGGAHPAGYGHYAQPCSEGDASRSPGPDRPHAVSSTQEIVQVWTQAKDARPPLG